MTSPLPSASPTFDEARRARRPSQGSMIGGVAAGLAEHLGLPVTPIRVGLLVSSLCGGIGILLYAALWMTMPVEPHFDRSTPGLESASRTGKRPNPKNLWTDVGPVVAIGAVCVGVFVLIGGLAGSMAFIWSLVMFLGGISLLWWQADQAQRERWWNDQGHVTPLRALFGHGSLSSYARVLGGLLLIVLGVMSFVLGTGDVRSALAVGAVTLIALVMLIVILGPLLFRLAADLNEERDERVRSQERADVAAHLHDSVLQTLALIQKSANDPTAVARLARAQERDLRTWLYDDSPASSESAATAMREVAADVEDSTAVPVEVVCVGDRTDIDPALLGATREALFNAAKHSGAPRVDLYAELGEICEVFVRDRGVGFDPEGIAADRHGVRDSIIARMKRHGGSAQVITNPGGGTEVRLRMPAKEDPTP